MTIKEVYSFLSEVASDGGPEFIAKETEDFLRRWDVRHRLSSVSFPSSNGRAELAVKATKRLLMDNVGPNGDLDNDRMVRSLLTQRNTPDSGCKISPAQILFGRPLRDTLPYIEKDIMTFNNPRINDNWRKAWGLKEEALKTRYVKSLENLKEHSKPPPLRHGDHVLLQNQSGRFPKKWDRSGIVVEIKINDQYVVKVAGTGRLTLRNRRFLRKYTHTALPNTIIDSIQPVTESIKMPPSIPPTGREPQSPDTPEEEREIATEATVPLEPTEAERKPNSPAAPTAQFQSRSPINIDTALSPPRTTTTEQSLATRSPVDPILRADVSLRRSARERRGKKFYDPSTGSYGDPSP